MPQNPDSSRRTSRHTSRSSVCRRKLTIDTAALERDFHKLSRKLHPDLMRARAGGAGLEPAPELAAERRLSHAERSCRRTEYLLKLEGAEIEDENSETPRSEDQANRVPADLLEEVFELNMQLEEMRVNEDGRGRSGAARRSGTRAGAIQSDAGLCR